MDDQLEDTPISQPEPGKGRMLTGASFWLGSAALHATTLMVMATVYYIVADQPEQDLPPMHVIPMPPAANKPVVEDHRKPDREDRPQYDLPPAEDLSEVKTVLDDTSADPPGDPEPLADTSTEVRGTPDAVTSYDAMNTSVFLAIGPGGDAAGKKGTRTPGPGRDHQSKKFGAPPGTTVRVTSALRWFKRHQSPDGSWEAERYQNNCQVGLKCEPGKNQSGDTTIALTAYAVLCFLGDGYDHRSPSTWAPTVKKGINYLIAHQKPDGLFGERNYEHAIATMVLAQAYSMSNDPDLRSPVQKGVEIILARQNPDPKAADKAYNGLGWDYVGPDNRNDSSVTGWNIMALKSAYVAGIDVKNGLTGSKSWLDRAWKAANTNQPWCSDPAKLDPYTGISRFPYTWDPTSDAVQISEWDAVRNAPKSTDAQDLAPVGLMCSVFLGHRAGDAMLDSLANYTLKYQLPKSYPCNTYALYYNTLGMFQVGGERWKQWNAQVGRMLIDAQRQDDTCFNGSWDWEGTRFHGSDTGRVLSTAYACLALQVYWIYDREHTAR